MTDPSPPADDAEGWAAPSDPAPIPPPYGPAPYGPAPYGPAPYGPGLYPISQGWGYGMAPPRTESLATTALVLSLVGVVMSFGCGIGVLLEIAALPTAIVARRRIRDADGGLTGSGQALAALIISAAVLVMVVLFIALIVGVNIAQSGSNT